MKRLIAISMLAVFLFAASCASGGNGQNELFDEDFSTMEFDMDLEGFDCQIRFYDHYATEDGTIFGYKPGSAYNDAAQKRVAEVEGEYNCSITSFNAASHALESDFSATLIAGLRFCDMIVSSSYGLRPTIRAGRYEPLSQVRDIIDYTDTKKWGNWRMLEQCVFNGDIYGVVPVQWPDVEPSGCLMFIFNEKFAGLLGQPDPREFIEDRSWSRDKLGEMMLAYTTEDLGYPLKAMLTYDGHFFDLALRANNAQAYKLVNGEYVSGYHTPEGLEALQWANDFLHVTYKDCLYPCPSSGRDDILLDEKVTMFLTSVTNIFGTNSRLPYSIEDYCILPMPNGPEREKQNAPYTSFFEWVRDTTLFPLNGTLDKSAIIANALFEPLEGFSEDELKEYCLRYNYHSEQDFYLAREIFENARCSFVSDNIRTLVVDALGSNGNVSIAELLDSTEEAQNERVREYLAPTASSLEGIFGSEALPQG